MIFVLNRSFASGGGGGRCATFSHYTILAIDDLRFADSRGKVESFFLFVFSQNLFDTSADLEKTLGC